jgi:thioredoxin reductase
VSGTLPVVVVGAGPAGLATSRELRRRGIEHRVLERGASVAHAWRGLYDSLRLHTGKHMSALPGMPFPKHVPLFPARADFLTYLERYTAAFELPVETSCEATRVEPVVGGFRVATPRGELAARCVVIATGILSNPVTPELPGRSAFHGTVAHAVSYRHPAPFLGRRVLLVGVGNSAGEIGSELARAGVRVTLSVRSGATALPRQVLGIPIQYFSRLMSGLPRTAQRAIVDLTGRAASLVRGRPVLPRPAPSSCPDVPLIGFELVEAIRAGVVRVKGPLEALTAHGVRFADGSEEVFDDVLFATGYRAALGLLAGVVSPDECGFAPRSRRVRSERWPGLYFVGHNYDGRGGLFNIACDSRRAARQIAFAAR